MSIKRPAIVTWLYLVLLCIYLPRVDAESLRCADFEVLCGPKTLLVVCRALGVEAELDELVKLSGFDEKTGATMLGLKKAAEAKGLRAVGMKIGAEELAQGSAPAIAHLWGDHFVVVEPGGADTVKVTNPPSNPVLVPLEELKKKYSGFALLIAKDEKAFPKPAANGPDLRCDAYDYGFGFIEQGDQAGHVFTLENKGVEDLVLSKVETSCTCTLAFLPKESRLPPGGKGELVVGFDSTGREGGQSQTVYIYSNDPISPIVQLRVGGVIKPTRLPVSARKLDFGTVKKRASATREFSVQDPGDRSLAVTEVKSDSPLVKTTLTRDDKQSLVYRVKAELQPGASIGEFKGKLTVCSNHSKEPVVEIPIAAEVIGDVETVPSQFFLGMLKKGQTASKTITLSTTSDEPLTIRKLKSPFRYVTLAVQPDVQGKRYSITATLKDTAPLGLIKGEVVIRTNNKDQREIKVPLFALVEE